MTVSLKTHKLLWGASGNTCAKCKTLLFEDATLVDDASLVGEEAHIVSKKKNGPRYNDPLQIERRDLAENLILLCNRCHKIVDDQVGTFTAEKLRQLKSSHEAEVREAITDEKAARVRDDLVYSDYIHHWETAADLDSWSAWTGSLLSSDTPSIKANFREQLVSLQGYLLARVWPKRYVDLEEAFITFFQVLGDLLQEFSRHAWLDRVQAGVIRTEKFYKTSGLLKQEDYRRRLAEYEFHTDTVRDLTLELTRAANLICDCVRRNISFSYRLSEGKLAVTLGPFLDFSYHTLVPEYRQVEQPGLYPGLEKFLKARESRDYTVGRGSNAIDGYLRR